MKKLMLICLLIVIAGTSFGAYDAVSVTLLDAPTSTNKALAKTATSVPIYGRLEEAYVDVTLFTTGGLGLTISLTGGMNYLADQVIYSNTDIKADTVLYLAPSNLVLVGDRIKLTAWHSARSTNDISVVASFSQEANDPVVVLQDAGAEKATVTSGRLDVNGLMVDSGGESATVTSNRLDCNVRIQDVGGELATVSNLRLDVNSLMVDSGGEIATVTSNRVDANVRIQDVGGELATVSNLRLDVNSLLVDSGAEAATVTSNRVDANVRIEDVGGELATVTGLRLDVNSRLQDSAGTQFRADAATNLPVVIRDAAGNAINLDSVDNGLQIIDSLHTHIHAGEAYVAGGFFADAADASTNYIHVVNSANQTLHMTWEIAAEGDGRMYFYTNNTFATAGTAAGVYCLSHDVCTTSSVLVYTAPTGLTNGTKFYPDQFVSGGSGPLSPGGGSAGRYEIIVDQSSDVIIGIANTSGGAKDYSLTVEWYEE